jgi:non-ribosomal peptide synthetase component F
MEDNFVTTTTFVPALLHMFLDHRSSWKNCCKSFVRLWVGGEALHTKLVMECKEKLPHTNVYNLYGPAEATIATTWFPATERLNDIRNTEIVPIGAPQFNAEVLVLDKLKRQVPFGVLGELHIGGTALAREYLGRPDLTAKGKRN